MKTIFALALSLVFAGFAQSQPSELKIDFSKPVGQWDLPRFALGQGGLQSDPMLAPYVKELRQLRPRTIRLFLSEFYRIYPAPEKYDFSKLDRPQFPRRQPRFLNPPNRRPLLKRLRDGVKIDHDHPLLLTTSNLMNNPLSGLIERIGNSQERGKSFHEKLP